MFSKHSQMVMLSKHDCVPKLAQSNKGRERMPRKCP